MNQYTSLWAFSLPMIAFLIALGIGLAFVPDKLNTDSTKKESAEIEQQTEELQSLPEEQQ